MPTRKEEFVNGEIYHITTRRVENNLLFQNKDDYYRGIFSIYEFNNVNLVEIRRRREERARFKKTIRNSRAVRNTAKSAVFRSPRALQVVEVDERDKLVEILCFCLMPNHLHLLLRQIQDGGISKFMQKLGAGYSGYFKRKYDLRQRGHFFQDRFVAVPVTTDRQLEVVFIYIHTNSISLIEPKWKEIGIKNPEKAIEFVENYKWSSYSDYIGKTNFPSVTEREFMLKVMGGPEGCREAVDNWIKHKGEIREFPDLALE